jgi:ribosomal protein L32
MEMNNNRRRGLVALIHMAKSRAMVCSKCGGIHFQATECPDCGRRLSHIPDFWYRSILENAGGKDSCALMDEAGLEKVMDVFNEAGYGKAYPYVSPKAEQARQDSAVRRNICRRAEEVLGPNWQGRLAGFVRAKFGKESLSFCGSSELRTVIGWINRLGKKEQSNED